MRPAAAISPVALALGAFALDAFVLAASQPALAQSLQDRIRFRNQETQITERAARTRDVCATTITPGFDWTGVNVADLSTYSASAHCEAALEAMEDLCAADPLARKAVQERVRTLTCGFGQRAASLKDGVLKFTIDWDAPNNIPYVKTYLLGAL